MLSRRDFIQNTALVALAASVPAVVCNAAPLVKPKQPRSDLTVWIDTINGVPGTDVYVNGTCRCPVDNIKDAFAIAEKLGDGCIISIDATRVVNTNW